MVHLSFFIGKLPRTIAGSSVHHCRRHNFRIARFACFVQEEVDEGALQLCAFTFIYRESRACNLNAQVEINQVIFLGQFPVGQGIFGKFGFHASHFLHHIVVGAYAFGHAIVGNVGNGVKQSLQIIGSLLHIGLQFFVGLFQFGHTALGGFRFFSLTLLHQLSDGFGE